MKLLTANTIYGLLIILISFLMAWRFKKQSAKVLIVTLGIALAAVVVFLPTISFQMALPKAPDDAEILYLLYGAEIDIQQDQDGGKPYLVKELSETEKEQFNYTSQMNTSLLYDERGWQGDPSRLVVLTATAPPECCARTEQFVLGGAVLAWENETWQVLFHQEFIAFINRSGADTEAESVQIGPQKDGIMITDHLFKNGTARVSDVIVTEANARLVAVVAIETGAHNAENCPPILDAEPCWEYSALYEWVPGSNPEFFDIRVTTSGTKLIDEKSVPFEEKSLYRFGEDVYDLVDREFTPAVQP